MNICYTQPYNFSTCALVHYTVSLTNNQITIAISKLGTTISRLHYEMAAVADAICVHTDEISALVNWKHLAL
jgi:hypothetical protein